jgi:hypothetical protein
MKRPERQQCSSCAAGEGVPGQRPAPGGRPDQVREAASAGEPAHASSRKATSSAVVSSGRSSSRKWPQSSARRAPHPPPCARSRGRRRRTRSPERSRAPAPGSGCLLRRPDRGPGRSWRQRDSPRGSHAPSRRRSSAGTPRPRQRSASPAFHTIPRASSRDRSQGRSPIRRSGSSGGWTSGPSLKLRDDR